MTGPESHVIYEFEGFRLDASRRLLFARSGAEPLAVAPKVVDALVYFVEHRGELLSKDRLLADLWPGRVVEENSLAHTVSGLRQVLGEAYGENRFVATVPGRGYRFVAEVTRHDQTASRPDEPRSDTPDATTARRTRPRRMAAVVLAALALAIAIATLLTYRWHAESQRVPAAAAVHTIAVLPFVDLSEDQDQQFFSDGLAESLLNRLSQAPALRVIARTSSFTFRGGNADIATIARTLKATHVVEGSVQRSGDRIRITAQLIDASTSAHLWSETFDRHLDDILSLQDEIATSIAGALRVTLAGGKQGQATPKSAEAYERFLEGRFFFNRRGPGDIQRAGNRYRQALEIDPDYARAWAGLAGVYSIEWADGEIHWDVGLQKLREAALKALALDPDLAEAHMRAASSYFFAGDNDAATFHYYKAMALAPNDPLVLGATGSIAASEGRLDEAIELFQRAAAIDPLSAVSRENLGHYLYYAGRFDEAETELSRARELGLDAASAGISLIHILRQDFGGALALISELSPGADRDQRLALAYHGLGRRADADAALARLIAGVGATGPWRLPEVQVAEVYAYRGDTDEAFKWLRKSIPESRAEPRSLDVWMDLWEATRSPLLVSLHDDPRWQAWLADSRFELP